MTTNIDERCRWDNRQPSTDITRCEALSLDDTSSPDPDLCYYRQCYNTKDKADAQLCAAHRYQQITYGNVQLWRNEMNLHPSKKLPAGEFAPVNPNVTQRWRNYVAKQNRVRLVSREIGILVNEYTRAKQAEYNLLRADVARRESDVNTLTNKIRDLNTTIQQSNARLEQLLLQQSGNYNNYNNGDTEKAIRDLSARVEYLNRINQEASSNLTRATQQLEALRAQNLRFSADLEAKTQEVNDLIRNSNRSREELEAIGSVGDEAEFAVLQKLRDTLGQALGPSAIRTSIGGPSTVRPLTPLSAPSTVVPSYLPSFTPTSFRSTSLAGPSTVVPSRSTTGITVTSPTASPTASPAALLTALSSTPSSRRTSLRYQDLESPRVFSPSTLTVNKAQEAADIAINAANIATQAVNVSREETKAAIAEVQHLISSGASPRDVRDAKEQVRRSSATATGRVRAEVTAIEAAIAANKGVDLVARARNQSEATKAAQKVETDTKRAVAASAAAVGTPTGRTNTPRGSTRRSSTRRSSTPRGNTPTSTRSNAQLTAQQLEEGYDTEPQRNPNFDYDSQGEEDEEEEEDEEDEEEGEEKKKPYTLAKPTRGKSVEERKMQIAWDAWLKDVAWRYATKQATIDELRRDIHEELKAAGISGLRNEEGKEIEGPPRGLSTPESVPFQLRLEDRLGEIKPLIKPQYLGANDWLDYLSRFSPRTVYRALQLMLGWNLKKRYIK